MQNLGVNPSRYGLEMHGIKNARVALWNLGTAPLIEYCLSQQEGVLASGGALVVRTGQHTGRSPQDKFVVCDPSVADKIWWGAVNQPFEPERFDALYRRVLAYLQDKRLFVQDCFVGADERYRIPIRVVTQYAWHNLFARQLFVRPDWTKTGEHKPEFVIVSAPGFHSDPEIDGTRSGAFIIVNFTRRIILIGGTEYAGEMKKSIFTIMNYLLPEQGVLSMHCAANMGPGGDVALFFGLSGTGKTSLSADPERRLVGDDEHGWSDDGIFNFEGGCYAKCIRLSKENEPQIWNAIRPTAATEGIRQPAGRSPAQAQGTGVVGEYRLDGRSVRRRTPSQHPLYAGNGACCTQGRPRRSGVPNGPYLRIACSEGVPRCPARDSGPSPDLAEQRGV